MFNTEIKVDGKFVRGTIKLTTPAPAEKPTSRTPYERGAAHAGAAYAFHGDIKRPNGLAPSVWSQQDLQDTQAELALVDEKLREMAEELHSVLVRKG